MKTEEALRKIEEEVTICQKCRLYQGATKAVPGSGSFEAEIMFVGEAPGFHEDQQGLPFVGRAGKLLDSLLQMIGKSREEVYICNVIKHRPPENRDPYPDEIAACKGYLDRQIEVIKPKMIVTLGRFGLNYFFPEAKISADHGIPKFWGSFLVYPVYHPAAALRSSAMEQVLRTDFVRIPEVIAKKEELAYKGSGFDNINGQMRIFK